MLFDLRSRGHGSYGGSGGPAAVAALAATASAESEAVVVAAGAADGDVADADGGVPSEAMALSLVSRLCPRALRRRAKRDAFQEIAVLAARAGLGAAGAVEMMQSRQSSMKVKNKTKDEAVAGCLETEGGKEDDRTKRRRQQTGAVDRDRGATLCWLN